MLIVDYFQSLFTSSTQKGSMKYVSNIERNVTNYMNEQLTVNFTTEEVHKALQQIHPTKDPSIDDMSSIVFQKYWHIRRICDKGCATCA